MTEPVLRLLLVEDHVSFRQAIEAVCALEPDLEVVGSADRGDEAGDVAAACRPDVALVDLDLPGGDGADAVRSVLARSDAVCLVLTGLTDDLALGEAVEAGASAVLHKSIEVPELLSAIRAVGRGANLLDPAITARWLQALARRRDDGWRARVTAESLSPREHEVLRLLAAGRSVGAIAEHLGITVPTVETHLRNLRAKLGAENRLEAVLVALQLGLVDPPPRYQ